MYTQRFQFGQKTIEEQQEIVDQGVKGQENIDRMKKDIKTTLSQILEAMSSCWQEITAAWAHLGAIETKTVVGGRWQVLLKGSEPSINYFPLYGKSAGFYKGSLGCSLELVEEVYDSRAFLCALVRSLHTNVTTNVLESYLKAAQKKF